MNKEIRTVVYDDELRIEAYRFVGIVQPFPNHFHEYYVIGFMEKGERCLSCKNQEYVIKKGDIVLFNPGDNHSCVHQHQGERGICPHCIRHTFAFRSFQHSEDSFENTVPFLSTYLGHENVMETDRYLRFSYELYTEAHEKISQYTEGVFPEVIR